MRQPWNVSKEKAIGMFVSPNGVRWILSGQQQLLESWLGGSLRAHDKKIDS